VKGAAKLLLMAWPIAALIGMWIYVLPMAFELIHGSPLGLLWSSDSASWAVPLARSCLFAVASATISVFGGLALGLRLARARRRRISAVAIMFVPLLMGGVAWGFVWKLLLAGSPSLTALIADRSAANVWSLLVAVQVWQFLPTCAALFALRFAGADVRQTEYGDVIGRSERETIRDLYWPYSRSLTGLLLLFCLAEGFQEYSKSRLLLRASPGTGTELVTHWLVRSYTYYAPVDPRGAMKDTLSSSAALAVFEMILSGLLVVVLLWLAGRAFGALASRPAGPAQRSSSGKGDVATVLAPLITVVPLLALVGYGIAVSSLSIYLLIRVAVLSCSAGILAALISWSAGFAARLRWPEALATLSRTAVVILVFSYGIFFVPPIALSFCTFYWLALLGFRDAGVVGVVSGWTLGQVVLAMPLLVSFVVYVHFVVRSAELVYQWTSRASVGEIASMSFFGRLMPDYFLLLVFGFSFVFNESGLNAMTSGSSKWVPSIAIELIQRVDGKGASYQEAVTLIVMSLVPVSVGVALLRRGINLRARL